MADASEYIRFMSLLRAFLGIGLALALGAARAQEVAQAPAPIVFAPWQQVAQTDEGTEYLETFPSPVTSPYPSNNVVPLRVFLPSGGKPSRAVLVLHYWGATDLRLERSLAQELNRRGIAAAILTLPYHLSRTPPGYRSGALAIQPDPQKLAQSMTQAVQDARRAIDFLATRPEIVTDRLGISGTSLGALVASLVVGVEPRITDASFLLGGVDLAHLMWSSSRVVPQRDALRRRGYTEDRLREALAPIEPLTYLKDRKLRTSFVVGGLFDTVMPRRNTEELIDALGTTNVLWLDTGHYGGIFVQRKLMREVATYFGKEFGDQTFVAPKRLYAPTIRIGFKIDTLSGLDLGVGLDLYKFDARGDSFSTLFVTPRGPQIFVGHRISQGLSIGALGSSRGIGLGLMWSSVL